TAARTRASRAPPAGGRCAPLPSQPAARPEHSPGGAMKLVAGDRVSHPMFGQGRVLSVTPSGGSTRAKIHFEGWGEKNLALEFAKLTKL
ncbi:MAG: hypothetical protein KDB07_04880, partial [Planctomycetes bacterium]|nr:hypothetical protein [Planctomycetota bacterium]